MAEDFTDAELDELEAAIHQLATHMKQRVARTDAQLERLATRMKQHALHVSGHYDRFEMSLQTLQHKIDLVAQGLDDLSPSSSVIVHAPLSLAAEITDDLSLVDGERRNAANKEESPLAIDDTAPINVVLSSPLAAVLANDCETVLEGDITFPNKDEAESFPIVNEMRFGPMCGISWSAVTPLQKVIPVPCVIFDMIVPEIGTNQVWGITSVLDLFYNSDLAFTLVQSSLHAFLSVMPCKCLIYCCTHLHDSNVCFPSLARFCTYVFDPGTLKVACFWSYHNFLMNIGDILITATIIQPFLGLGNCFGGLVIALRYGKLVLWLCALQHAVGMDVSSSFIFIQQLRDMKWISHVLVGDFAGFYFANFTGQLLKPAWFHLDSNWPIHLGGGLYFGTIEIVFIYLLYLREFPEVHMDFLIQALPFIHFCFKPCVVFQSFYVPSTMHSICLFNCLIKVHVSLAESPSLFLFFIYVFDPGAVQSFGLLLWSEFMTKKHTTYKGVSVLKQLLSKLSSCLQLKDCHEAFSVNNEDLDYHLMICLLYFTSRIYDMLMMSFGAISCVYLGQSGMRVVTIALVVGLSIASESYFNYCNTKRFNCFMFSVLQFKLIIQGERYEYYAHDLVAVVKYFYICVFETITCFRVLFWLHVEVLDSTESNKTILKKLSTIFYFAFSMRQHQWLVKVIIHGNRYEGATLFIQDRKPWFSFNLVAWNGLDPPCRAT